MLEDSRFQARVILTPKTSVPMPGDFFRKLFLIATIRVLLLTPSGQRPGMLLNHLQDTGQSLQCTSVQPEVVTVLQLGRLLHAGPG